jgi:hypothetical protein
MNTLYKIQKKQSINSNVRDMSAIESAIFHIPTALKTNIPHIAVSFSAISIRDITALLSSPQLKITEKDRKNFISLVKVLSKNITNQIDIVLPRKTDNIFSNIKNRNK